MLSVPKSTNVLVAGGGPGGATAATLLARHGFEVTLLEKARFPRYHIGESLLPTILPILDLMGARDLIERFGFQRKQGAFLKWGSEEWALDFGELTGDLTYSFQVTRAEFDHLLLEHAKSQGVRVVEGVDVTAIQFNGKRPVSASWAANRDSGALNGKAGRIDFRHLIDATGRCGLLANRYLKNRRYHKIFQNVAVWGYWKGADRLATGREGDIAVNSIPNGWLWAIPLQDDIMSVGVVMHKDEPASRKPFVLERVLLDAIQQGETIRQIVRDAELVSKVHTETDYSYASKRFCGPGFFMVGDSAWFLDPLLSSGVHLTTFSALLAAAGLISFAAEESARRR